ncbi:helix-turn-helix transcriptional regulator [Paenibacillus sp.]|uniref:helix-turn-helix transcriptional regulator n=1 Tax=Paenibacillus sp. TaxID=58172 RepID=UPI002D45C72C|nr:helix-turn-helix transcriptional regulator [Paenibacillus sp.]HZG58137.1 helix-turn-helix transcriptional regulator [Paenibacillus sp.]
MELPPHAFFDHEFNASLLSFPVYCANKSVEPTLQGMHAHHGFEFQFAFSNESVVSVGASAYTVKPGHVILIPPLVYHTVKPLQKSVYRRTILSVEETYFRRLAKSETDIGELLQAWFPAEETLPVEFAIEKSELYRIRELLLELEEELRLRREGFALFVKSLLIQVLVLLGRGRARATERADEALSADIREICERMVEHIRESCCEPLQVSEIARSFHVSKSYMFKVFKAYTGYTPHQYLTMQRIYKAKEMLENGGESVTAIAARTGFNDSSHFIRTFKESTGMTPAEYKNMTHRGSAP